MIPCIKAASIVMQRVSPGILCTPALPENSLYVLPHLWELESRFAQLFFCAHHFAPANYGACIFLHLLCIARAKTQVHVFTVSGICTSKRREWVDAWLEITSFSMVHEHQQYWLQIVGGSNAWAPLNAATREMLYVRR